MNRPTQTRPERVGRQESRDSRERVSECQDLRGRLGFLKVSVAAESQAATVLAVCELGCGVLLSGRGRRRTVCWCWGGSAKGTAGQVWALLVATTTASMAVIESAIAGCESSVHDSRTAAQVVCEEQEARPEVRRRGGEAGVTRASFEQGSAGQGRQTCGVASLGNNSDTS